MPPACPALYVSANSGVHARRRIPEPSYMDREEPAETGKNELVEVVGVCLSRNPQGNAVARCLTGQRNRVNQALFMATRTRNARHGKLR